MQASEDLKNWIRLNGLKKGWVAAQINVAPSTLLAWTSGARAPLPALADRLEALTNGAVRAADWRREG